MRGISDGDTTMHGLGSNQGFWNLLTPNEQDALVARGRDKKYPPGADLCVQGDPATHVFVLMNGWVKLLSVTDDGHQSVLALRGDGDIVGETAGGTTGQRQTTMKAINTVHALIVGYERFSSFLETYPRAGKAYRRVMTQRWNDADALLRKRSVTNGACSTSQDGRPAKRTVPSRSRCRCRRKNWPAWLEHRVLPSRGRSVTGGTVGSSAPASAALRSLIRRASGKPRGQR